MGTPRPGPPHLCHLWFHLPVVFYIQTLTHTLFPPFRTLSSGISRSEIDEQAAKFSFDPCKQKTVRSRDLNHRQVTEPCQFPSKPVYRPRNPLNEREISVFGEGPHYTARNVYCSSLSQPSPKGPMAFYQGNYALGKRKYSGHLGASGHWP